MASALDDVRGAARSHREQRQRARQAADHYAQAVKTALDAGEPVRLVAVAAGVTVDGVYKLIHRRWPKPKEITEQVPALDDDQPAPLTD